MRHRFMLTIAVVAVLSPHAAPTPPPRRRTVTPV